MRNKKQIIYPKNKKSPSLISLNKDINSLSHLNLSDIYKTLQDKENIKYNNNTIALSIFQKNNKLIQNQNKKYTKINKNPLKPDAKKNNISKKLSKIKQAKSFNEYQFYQFYYMNKTINANTYNKPIKKSNINNLIHNNNTNTNNLPKNIINNFSQTTYNIYNINTMPLYNQTNYPLKNRKKFFSPKYINDNSYFSNKNKKINFSKTILNNTDNENEKNQSISSFRPFSYDKNRDNYNKIKNKKKNKKHISNITNIYGNKNSFFKSPFDNSSLSIIKNPDKDKNKNTISTKQKFKLNKNKISNKEKKITGLKKYLRLSSPTVQSNKPNSKINSREKSISFLSQLNNSCINKNIKNSEQKKIIMKKVMKINSCTLAGYKSNGMQKLNQDKFFIKKDFLDEPEQFFIGVCDGHGMHGHFISEYASKFLPKNLNSISNDESIKSAFISTQKSLLTENTKIDSSLSGSTCASVIISPSKIICANLGNSRAILARHEKGIYTVLNLSHDHILTEHDEMKRVLNKGGIIKQFYNNKNKEYFGPQRIFLKNSEIPGLTISRSFGDSIAHNIGVISEPDVFRFNYNGNEKFIVIATEGIWKYIDSEECVNILKDFYENDMDAVGGLNMLVKEAFKRWKNEEGNVEDITAIVVFFE